MKISPMPWKLSVNAHVTSKKRVMEVLDLVGLKHKVRSFPNELSGGEQQRVAIARSIANAPKVLIADEPTGNLDPENSWEIMNLLEKINIQGTTILMATHNSQIVNTLASPRDCD
jgi:cell division transport system ATP-binding protein